ncbi:hypothetical protein FKP32DRAFT_1672850 [Trametes sanguinea]|nr:hypothetical protein FKP32DRAFT_1672850 [Trametes sanguinea]
MSLRLLVAWATPPLLLLLIIVPLLTMMAPYISFHFHSSAIPLNSSHIHLVDTSASIAQATGLILCSLLPIKRLAFVCENHLLESQPQVSNTSLGAPWSRECRNFTDFVFRRGELYAEIASELTMVEPAVVLLASLGPAVEKIIAQCHHSGLYKREGMGEDLEGLKGKLDTGAIVSLRDISALSLTVRQAASELFWHVEVGMTGAIVLDVILSNRLYIERLKDAALLRSPSKSLDMSPFASLSVNATVNTLRHILNEVRRVHLITSALDTSLKNLIVHINPKSVSPGTVLPPVRCIPIATLVRGAHGVRMLQNALRDIEDAIYMATQGYPLHALSAASFAFCPPWFLGGLLDGDLRAFVRLMNETRNAVERVVRANNAFASGLV